MTLQPLPSEFHFLFYQCVPYENILKLLMTKLLVKKKQCPAIDILRQLGIPYREH
jgi:hypothetical protein